MVSAVPVQVLVFDRAGEAEIAARAQTRYTEEPKIAVMIGVVVGRSTMPAQAGSCSMWRDPEEEP